MFVGIRRSMRFACAAKNRTEEEEEKELQQEGEGFWRRGRGKVSVKEVALAAEAAAQNMPFEVVYYPRAGRSDFVVKAEAVEEAMRGAWGHGMRVKMAVETEDSSRMTWFQGTVSSASAPDNGPWRGSPWRMLQVYMLCLLVFYGIQIDLSLVGLCYPICIKLNILVYDL